MRLEVIERDRHYRLTFSFRRDKVSDECYSMCLPKAESPAELAIVLGDESHILSQAIMHHIRKRCGDYVTALGYPTDAPLKDEE